MTIGPLPPQVEAEFWHDVRMPYVETRRACQSRTCYQAHSHPTFSIGAVDHGQSQFKSYLSPSHVIQAGSIVMIPAHVEHTCNPLPEQAWSYQMMHLQLDWLSALVQESSKQHLQDLTPYQQCLQHHDLHALVPQFVPRVIHDPALYL